VEETHKEVHLNNEQELEEPVQEVVVKYLHHTKVLVHHNSTWQDMIPPSGYQNLGEKHQRIPKRTYSSMRRSGKQIILQMRIKKLRSYVSH
jgi:hypothetical protein